MNTSTDQLLVIIRDFLCAHGLDNVQISVETKLLRDGYLDSFSVIELIVVLERKLGITVASGAVLPEDFESVASLHARLEQL